jgi:hypothetical protein
MESLNCVYVILWVAVVIHAYKFLYIQTLLPFRRHIKSRSPIVIFL